MSQRRLPFVDIAKALGIVLVVLGHTLELYFNPSLNAVGRTSYWQDTFLVWKLIYAFHMPLFFFLSGLAAGADEKPARQVFVGVLQLLCLVGAIQLVTAPLRIALPLPTETPPETLRAIFAFILKPAIFLQYPALGVTWFLLTLALVRLVSFALATAGSTTARGAIWLTLLLAYGLAKWTGKSAFSACNLVACVLFFEIGRMTLSRLKQDASAKVLGFIAFGATAVTLATFNWNQGCPFELGTACLPADRATDFGVLMVDGDFGFLPFFALTALAGIAAITALSMLLARLPADLGRLGRMSLDIFIVNGLFFVFVFPAIASRTVDVSPWLTVPALVAAQIAASLMAHKPLAALSRSMRSLAEMLVDRGLALGKLGELKG